MPMIIVGYQLPPLDERRWPWTTAYLAQLALGHEATADEAVELGVACCFPLAMPDAIPEWIDDAPTDRYEAAS